MPRFRDVDVFIAVADAGSFRGAARSLDVTKSTVSRAVQRLEADLGVTLLVRDHSAVRLTDSGLAYLRFARTAAEALSDGERALAALTGGVAGTVRVTAPPALGPVVLAELCGEFLAEYPQAEIELTLSDDLVSLSALPFDLAVRAGPRLRDSDLKSRRLAQAPMVAVAAPQVADALENGDAATLIEFVRNGVPLRAGASPPVSIAARWRVNDYMSLKEAAVGGHGVGVLSELLVAGELADGRLVRVFESWVLPIANYWAVYPGSGPLPQTTRVLLDHLVRGFAARASQLSDTPRG